MDLHTYELDQRGAALLGASVSLAIAFALMMLSA